MRNTLFNCQCLAWFRVHAAFLQIMSTWPTSPHGTQSIVSSPASWCLVRILVMRAYTRPLIYILYLTCCGVAIFCFLRAKRQKSLNADGFVFWHNGWHWIAIWIDDGLNMGSTICPMSEIVCFLVLNFTYSHVENSLFFALDFAISL